MTTLRKFIVGTFDANFYKNNLQKYASHDVNEDIIIEIDVGGVDIFHGSFSHVSD